MLADKPSMPMNKLLEASMRFLLIVILFFLAGCATSDQYVRYQDTNTPKPENCDLDIYSQNLELHKKTQVIGEIQIKDTGFSVNCDSETVMAKIKIIACKEGADAIHIYNVRHPSWSASTCFQANARFLKYD